MAWVLEMGPVGLVFSCPVEQAILLNHASSPVSFNSFPEYAFHLIGLSGRGSG